MSDDSQGVEAPNGGGAVITVRGEWQEDYPPDRATLRARVVVVGLERAAVLREAAATAERFAAAVAPLIDAERGPATSRASDQIQVWTQERWDKKGNSVAPEHHATVDETVVFSDFVALSALVDDIVAWENVRVHHVLWDLTPQRRREAERDVRLAAVAAARQRGEDYAQAAGLGELTVESISDRGMLGGGDGRPHPVAFGASRNAAAPMSFSGEGPAFSYVPEIVTVHAAVDMRFRASG